MKQLDLACTAGGSVNGQPLGKLGQILMKFNM
jgi:hypothetical protein